MCDEPWCAERVCSFGILLLCLCVPAICGVYVMKVSEKKDVVDDMAVQVW